MAAPKPKPPVLKLVEGRSPGRDSGGRPIAPTPGYVRLPPEAPEWLPDEARAEWERIVPELQRLQLTKSIDRSALTAYCVCWDRFVTATRTVLDEGQLHTNSQGVTRHPAVAIAEAASKELRSWCTEFGLTPSAENRMRAPEAPDGDANPFA